MTGYTTKLIKKELIAENTMAFYFEKPEGLTFQAGQYADYTLIDPPETDKEGNKRTFSFASAPSEPHIMIATRMRDTAFKRVLKAMPEGAEVHLEGPFGSFVLPKDATKPAVFLTGGIGATFARSMITQATQEGRQQPMTFIYSNHRPEEAAFLDELTKLAEQNSHFTFVPTMTDAGSDWRGERGQITLDMVQKYVPDLNAPVYYLSGPGEMLGAMRTMLIHAGVNKFNLRADQFVGYSQASGS